MDKPKVVVAAEIILVSAAIAALGQYIVSAAMSYLECGPAQKMMFAFVLVVTAGGMLRLFAGIVLYFGLVDKWISFHIPIKLSGRMFFAMTVAVLYWIMMVSAQEVLAWSYNKSEAVAECSTADAN